MITDIEKLSELPVGTVDELDVVINGNKYKSKFKVEDCEKMHINKFVCKSCILYTLNYIGCSHQCHDIDRPDKKNVVFLKL